MSIQDKNNDMQRGGVINSKTLNDYFSTLEIVTNAMQCQTSEEMMHKLADNLDGKTLSRNELLAIFDPFRTYAFAPK